MIRPQQTLAQPLGVHLQAWEADGAAVCEIPRHAPEDPTAAFESKAKAALGKKLRDVGRLGRPRGSALSEVLTRHQFLRELRREQLRADRLKCPLSIAICFFDDGSGVHQVEELLQRLCSIKRETDFLGYLSEDVVALALPGSDENGTQHVVKRITSGIDGMRFSVATGTYPDDIFDYLKSDSETHQENSYPFAFQCAAEPHVYGHAVKRLIDIVGATTALLIMSPLMLLVALVIKLTAPGPVIYKQVRLGQRGAPFVFYKFRSMYSNADDRIHRQYVADLIRGNLDDINQGTRDRPKYKMRSDPRITRVGRILRRTSMDELPQLFNVLRGEMSLVGPRPPIPYEAEKYQPWHLRRILEAKPGITGLWQVEGRSRVSFDDMVRLDLRYARDWSLILDLKILLRTVKVVLQCEGAD